MTAEDFLKQPLHWKKHSAQRYYYTYFNEVPLLLRMNDFPDEPLYTFTYLLDIIHIDDFPETWRIDYD